MKKIILLIVAGMLLPIAIQAQTNKDSIAFHQSLISEQQNSNVKTISARSTGTDYSGSFFIGGNEDTYYPVAFNDNAWNYHQTSVLELGRASTHENGLWHGSLITTFRYHLSRWGNGSNFIDADMKQESRIGKLFIAGWHDVSWNSGSLYLIIWLRGNTTYYFNCNYPQTPIFTSGSIVLAENTFLPKTAIESYVNTSGTSLSRNIWVTGNQSNYFKGNVGIGTNNPKKLLDVAGTIHAQNIEVDLNGWSDFVFDKDYRLPSLKEVEEHIKEHKHLPDIPSEAQVKEEGINIGEMQAKLLQKIEELTLYVIQQEKKNIEQEKEITILKKENKQIREQFQNLR